MQDEREEPEKSYKESYGGKRPLWQWVVIYLIIGALIYGVVYYFFLGGSNKYSLPGNSSTPAPTSTSKGPLGY